MYNAMLYTGLMARPREKNTTLIAVRLPAQLAEDVRTLTAIEGVTISDVVRDSLRRYRNRRRDLLPEAPE